MQKEATFIRLHPELKQVLARIAKADGRSLSSLMSKAVTDWLTSKPEFATEAVALIRKGVLPAKEPRR